MAICRVPVKQIQQVQTDRDLFSSHSLKHLILYKLENSSSSWQSTHWTCLLEEDQSNARRVGENCGTLLLARGFRQNELIINLERERRRR